VSGSRLRRQSKRIAQRRAKRGRILSPAFAIRKSRTNEAGRVREDKERCSIIECDSESSILPKGKSQRFASDLPTIREPFRRTNCALPEVGDADV